MERVRVHRFFKGLAKEILARFGVRDVLENREHDVVADEALARAEEPEIALDDLAFRVRKLVGLPQLDVALHRHFRRHPVVVAAVEVMLPRPMIFQGHELIDVDLAAIQQPFVFNVDALG